MLSFESSDKKYYSVPENFIKKYGGYFELISDGTLPLTSCQIDFLFFDEDRFGRDTFVQSIPTILQFSNQKFNQKVLEKIEDLMSLDRICSKNDKENLLNILAHSITENSTYSALKKIMKLYLESIWSTNKELITSRFLLLKKEIEKKQYFMTLRCFDEEILSCLGKKLQPYFECDTFVSHLLGHFYSPFLDHFPSKMMDAILSYSSVSSIRYCMNSPFRYRVIHGKWLASSISSMNPISLKYPIHYICERSLTELIVEWVEKNPLCAEHMDRFKKKAVHYICQFSTLKMLQYIIQKTKNISFLIDLTGYNLNDYLLANKNPDIIAFLKEIDFDPDEMDLEDIKIKKGW